PGIVLADRGRRVRRAGRRLRRLPGHVRDHAAHQGLPDRDPAHGAEPGGDRRLRRRLRRALLRPAARQARSGGPARAVGCLPGHPRPVRVPRRQAHLPLWRPGRRRSHPGGRLRRHPPRTPAASASPAGALDARQLALTPPLRTGKESPMSIAALITWVITALGGFYLLGSWISRGGVAQQRDGTSRLRAPLIFGHFL